MATHSWSHAPDGHQVATFRRPVRVVLVRLARGIRGRHLLVIDLVGVFVAAYLALLIRFDGLDDLGRLAAFAPIVLAVTLIRVAVGTPVGLYSRDWRSASIPDLERIVAAVSLGTIIAIGVWLVAVLTGAIGTVVVPRTFWIAEMVLSLAVLGAVRFGIRAASDWRMSTSQRVARDPKATLLYGAGHAGALVARSARHEPRAGVIPVGFLDDDPALAGGFVAGVRVYGGLDALPRAMAATGASELLITMPSAPGSAIRGIVEAAAGLELPVRTVPSLTDLLDGTVDTHRLREVQIEDLLRRPIVKEHHTDDVEAIIRDRVIVITGAGGSIGSELARQVFALDPARLVLVDRAESALYMVERELESHRTSRPVATKLLACLDDVTDAEAMDRLMGAVRPEVVFHAAAYKHVPLMEAYPAHAIHTNAHGTLTVLEAAERAGVDRFVLVSTDKAVRPTSVMGATKRLAEMLVAESALRTGRPYVSVRFGNVLGSNGSVLPIFQAQLQKGEPLTITDPAATRYFMTIPEAAWLILDAAAMARTAGDLFVLDMGEPVRVLDLARDLVRLSGRDPDAHPIEVVGLRPGEKLHEQLFYDLEEVAPTTSPKVLRVRGGAPVGDPRRVVATLREMAAAGADREVRSALFAAAWADERPEAETAPAPSAIPVLGTLDPVLHRLGASAGQ